MEADSDSPLSFTSKDMVDRTRKLQKALLPRFPPESGGSRQAVVPPSSGRLTDLATREK